MDRLFLKALQTVIKKTPGVIPNLKGYARWIAFAFGEYESFGYLYTERKTFIYREIDFANKTQDYFLDTLNRLIRAVYEGNLGGEFIDIMANLLSGQINQAFREAWAAEGTEDAMPDYMSNAAESMILQQFDFVDQLYRDIVDARIDEEPIDPLLARAPLWAQRWTEAYNEGIHLITLHNGGKERWDLGATEEHCTTCAGLDGVVAFASEWDALGVKPQNAPNPLLECGGWQCDCKRTPTDQRRSPKAYDTILNIVTK